MLDEVSRGPAIRNSTAIAVAVIRSDLRCFSLEVLDARIHGLSSSEHRQNRLARRKPLSCGGNVGELRHVPRLPRFGERLAPRPFFGKLVKPPCKEYRFGKDFTLRTCSANKA